MTVRVMLPAILGVVFGGCSLILDFEQCKTDVDCVSGQVCQDSLCVQPSGGTAGGDTAGDTATGDATAGTGGDEGTTTGGDLIAQLLAPPCTKFYGVEREDLLSDDTLLLATLLPATGPLAEYGPPIDDAVLLATEEINQVGGIFGKKIGVVSCDTEHDAVNSALVVQRLKDIGNVPAIIGAAASSITIDVFNDGAKPAGVLMISPASTASTITSLDDNGLLWRTAPSDAIQGEGIAKLILSENFRKVAVVNRNDAYGNALRDKVVDVLCQSMNCEEDLANYTYSDDTVGADQSNALVQLGEFEPDVIVLIAFIEDGVAFINQASEAGLKRFILTDGMRSKDIIAKVTDPEVLCQAFGTIAAEPGGDAYKSFRIRYKARFNRDPGAFNANAYDAMYLLGYALAAFDLPAYSGADVAAGLARTVGGDLLVQAGTQQWTQATATLRNTVDASIDFDGTSGKLDFDLATGEAASSIECWAFDLEKQDVRSLGVIFDGGPYLPPAEGLPQCTEADGGGTTAGGETTGGSTTGGSTTGGSTTDGSTTDGSTTDGSTTDGSTTDGSTTDGSTTDGDATGGDASMGGGTES